MLSKYLWWRHDPHYYFINEDKTGILKIILSPSLINIFDQDKIPIIIFFSPEIHRSKDSRDHIVTVIDWVIDCHKRLKVLIREYLILLKSVLSLSRQLYRLYTCAIILPHKLMLYSFSVLLWQDSDIHPFILNLIKIFSPEILCIEGL